MSRILSAKRATVSPVEALVRKEPRIEKRIEKLGAQGAKRAK
jgi:hypothetical protein